MVLISALLLAFPLALMVLGRVVATPTYQSDGSFSQSSFSTSAEECLNALLTFSQPSYSHADKLLRMMQSSSTFACAEDDVLDKIDGGLRSIVAEKIFNSTLCRYGLAPEIFCQSVAAAAESVAAIPDWARIPIALYEALLSASTNPQALNVSGVGCIVVGGLRVSFVARSFSLARVDHEGICKKRYWRRLLDMRVLR